MKSKRIKHFFLEYTLKNVQGRGVFYMERLMSDEEKIRRAIEISQRRNQNNYSRETTRVNVNDKKEYKLFKKMILQIIICQILNNH